MPLQPVSHASTVSPHTVDSHNVAQQHFTVNDAKITIKNLRLRTYIGFNPDELEKKQDVVINAEIEYDATNASSSDDESLALNYKTITKAMIAHTEAGHFRLLEKLVNDLLQISMSHASVLKAQVTVDKPHALRFADSVSLTLAAYRNALRS